MRNVHASAVLVGALMASPVLAATIQPTSYDTLNGNQGSFTYYDDSYSGTGDKTVANAPLTGGLGDLTDGVIATQNWINTPGPYVGWTNLDPTITFHFPAGTTINAITVHVDDSNGTGGVVAPQRIDVQMDAGPVQQFPVTDPPSSEPFAVNITGLNLVGSDLKLTGVRNGSWIFFSEVDFEGSFIPEPASMSLLALASAGALLRHRA